MYVKKAYDGRRRENKTNTREMLENSTLCPSQQYSELYTKLKTERQLDRFIAILQFCSSTGKTLDDTLEYIIDKFGGFLNKKTFNISALCGLINTYGEIGKAWGFGSDGDVINDIMIKNKAVDMIMRSTDMSDIEIYSKIYNNKIKDINDKKPTSYTFTLTANEGDLPD